MFGVPRSAIEIEPRTNGGPRRPRRPGPGSPSRSGWISKHFGTGERRVAALKEVSWEVYAGQMSMIVGPSGCGKTTLLSVVAGILNADEGSVTIFGEEVSAMTRPGPDPVPGLAHRLRLPAIQPPAGPDRRRERGDPAGDRRLVQEPKAVHKAKEVLDSLGMGKKTESYPQPAFRRPAAAGGDLPGPGPRAQLLVCDEPTAALDHETGLSVMELLQRGRRQARPRGRRRHARQPGLPLRRPDRPHGRRPARPGRGQDRWSRPSRPIESQIQDFSHFRSEDLPGKTPFPEIPAEEFHDQEAALAPDRDGRLRLRRLHGGQGPRDPAGRAR